MEDGEISEKLLSCRDNSEGMSELTNGVGGGMQRSKSGHHLRR